MRVSILIRNMLSLGQSVDVRTVEPVHDLHIILCRSNRGGDRDTSGIGSGFEQTSELSGLGVAIGHIIRLRTRDVGRQYYIGLFTFFHHESPRF